MRIEITSYSKGHTGQVFEDGLSTYNVGPLNIIKGRIAVEMGIVEMYCGVLDV